MVKKLDRYILSKFLSAFFFCMLLFTIIAVVIDVSEKTDDFVKAKLSATDVFLKYYTGFIPFINGLLFPLFVFIAVIFFTSQMAGRSEIVAILASGTSFNRFLRPYMAGGILLGIVLLLLNAFIIPPANGIRTDFELKYIKVNSTYDPLVNRFERNIYFRIDSFTYAGIRSYDTFSKSGGPFFINKIKNDRVLLNIRSERIQWDTARKKWKLQNVCERRLDTLKEIIIQERERLTNYNFTTAELSQDAYTKDKLSSPELLKLIEREKVRGTEGLKVLQVEHYRRVATPVAVVILTIIGACIASRKVRGGSGAHLGLGLALASVFIIMDRFSTIFCTKGNLPPLIAAWLPNFIFLVITWYIYKRAPK
jgi:lipopolysaccharide export system permease protein